MATVSVAIVGVAVIEEGVVLGAMDVAMLVGVGGAVVDVGPPALVGITARKACELPLGSTASPTITLPSDEMPSANWRNHVPAGQGT